MQSQGSFHKSLHCGAAEHFNSGSLIPASSSSCVTFRCFCGCMCVYCVHWGVHICGNPHTHIWITPRLDCNLGYHFLVIVQLVHLSCVSCQSETYQEGCANLTVTPSDLPNSAFPVLRLQVPPHLVFSTCVLGADLGSSCLQGKHITDQANSPTPYMLISSLSI